ncbi:MAG: hypothetical protein AB7O31_12165 [Burkholderiales bacterium]
MKRHFVFAGRDSFRSPQSEELALLLLREGPVVLRGLKEDLGLSLEFESKSVRMAHDGRKLGIASIPSSKGEISVSIAPKVDSMRVRAMLEDVKNYEGSFPQLSISARSALGNVEKGHDDLSIAFALALLRDIIDCAHLLEGAFNRRYTVNIQGGIRGRPLIERSMIDLLLGRSLGFSCEVPSDEHLKEYQRVLLATGLNIIEALGVWLPTLYREGMTSESLRARLIAAFRGLDVSSISLVSVLRVCRPPFPFGLKDVLYRALRYWKWRSQYTPSNADSIGEKFFSMSIYLDKLFEIYVGAFFRQVCAGHLVSKASVSHGYSFVRGGETIKREIVLDHVLESKGQKNIFVVDAKYSEAEASPHQVYQLIAYLNYKYAEFPHARMIGVLAYPGDDWQVGEVLGFNKKLFVVKIPVPVASCLQQGKNFVSDLVSFKEEVR